MEIKIQIDENCKHCKRGLAYLKKLYKQNKKAYGSYILHPVSRLIKEKRDLGEQDRIKGIKLIPDYSNPQKQAAKVRQFSLQQREPQCQIKFSTITGSENLENSELFH